MSKGKKIKLLREALNMTQTELAQKTKSSKQTIYKYENDIITNIPSDKIMALAKALNTTPMYLMGWSDEINPAPALDLSKFDNIYPVKLKKFPLLGEIACGKPIFANEDRESYVLAGADIHADFCLRAKGEIGRAHV